MSNTEELFLPEIPLFIAQYFTDTFKGDQYLLPTEALIVKNASEKRRTDFSTGRYCARQALDKLIGIKPEIMQGEGREPLWPAGVVGSISHSNKWAGAIVALQSNVAAIGVDIETIGGVKADMWDLIFLESEQELIRSKQQDTDVWATLLFSLKEAFYKLQYPLTRLFVDFRDLGISETNGKLSFSSASLGLSPVLLNTVEVLWMQVDDQLISICYISSKSLNK